MFCKKCGKQIGDDVRFCDNCGAVNTNPVNTNPVNTNPVNTNPVNTNPVNANPVNTYPVNANPVIPNPIITNQVRKKSNKKPLVFVLVLLVIAVVVAVVVPFMKKDKDNQYTVFSDKALNVRESGTKKLTIYNSDLNLYEELIGENIWYSLCLDKSAAMIQYKSNNNSNLTLHYISEKGLVFLDDNVEAAEITDNGNGVIYKCDDSGEKILKYYDAIKEKVKIIDGSEDIILFAISPNGEAIIYSFYDGMKTKTYVYKNNKKTRLDGDELIPIAISDDAEYIYYRTKDEGYSYLLLDDDEIRLSKGSVSIFFNKDYTECIFMEPDNICIYADGKIHDIYDLSYGRTYKLLAPSNCYYLDPFYFNYGYNMYFTLGIDSFRNKSLSIGKKDEVAGFVYIDNDFEASITTIESSKISVILSEKGKRLIYKDLAGDVYKINDVTRDDDSELLVRDMNVTDMVGNSDLSMVYYISDNKDLYCIKGKKEPVHLAEDVLVVGIGEDNNTFYYIADNEGEYGDLYYSKNGEEGKRVKEGKDVKMIVYPDVSSGYLKYGSDDIYVIGKDGKSLIEIN